LNSNQVNHWNWWIGSGDWDYPIKSRHEKITKLNSQL
jgi:hypothetical protein